MLLAQISLEIALRLLAGIHSDRKPVGRKKNTNINNANKIILHSLSHSIP